MTESESLTPQINSREELARHILALVERVESGAMPLENATAVAYMKAAAYWINDSPGFFANNGLEVPETPDWSLIGMIFNAACVYE